MNVFFLSLGPVPENRAPVQYQYNFLKINHHFLARVTPMAPAGLLIGLFRHPVHGPRVLPSLTHPTSVTAADKRGSRGTSPSNGSCRANPGIPHHTHLPLPCRPWATLARKAQSPPSLPSKVLVSPCGKGLPRAWGQELTPGSPWGCFPHRSPQVSQVPALPCTSSGLAVPPPRPYLLPRDLRSVADLLHPEDCNPGT